ncbi:MAG: hypothetical protein ACOX9E_06730 [Lentisphaeria bacterium]|jgi:hypothetical protein
MNEIIVVCRIEMAEPNVSRRFRKTRPPIEKVMCLSYAQALFFYPQITQISADCFWGGLFGIGLGFFVSRASAFFLSADYAD